MRKTNPEAPEEDAADEHLLDVAGGPGCTEIRERLSEVREEHGRRARVS